MRSQVFQQVRSRIRSRFTTGTIVLFTAAVVVAGMYLAVSMKSARIGREVIRLESRKEVVGRSNNELAARLAAETSPQVLWERAKALGYRSVKSQEVEYLVVTGFQEEEDFTAPRPSSYGVEGEAVISPAYTESLIDWFSRWMDLKPEQE